MPLTIFNLSKVDNLYIGKDTVVTFADAPEFEHTMSKLPAKTRSENI